MAILIGSCKSRQAKITPWEKYTKISTQIYWSIGKISENTRQQFQPKLIAIFASTISTKVGSIAPLLDVVTIEVLVINGCMRGISLALIADIYPNVKLIWPSLRVIWLYLFKLKHLAVMLADVYNRKFEVNLKRWWLWAFEWLYAQIL